MQEQVLHDDAQRAWVAETQGITLYLKDESTHPSGSLKHPLPRWIAVGAGTGGTSATIGRYIRYRREALAVTRLAVVDPEGSVFYDAVVQRYHDTVFAPGWIDAQGLGTQADLHDSAAAA